MQWLKGARKDQKQWLKQTTSQPHDLLLSVNVCVIFRKALKPTLLTLITLRHIHFRLVGAGNNFFPLFFWKMPKNAVYFLYKMHHLFSSVSCCNFLFLVATVSVIVLAVCVVRLRLYILIRICTVWISRIFIVRCSVIDWTIGFITIQQSYYIVIVIVCIHD